MPNSESEIDSSSDPDSSESNTYTNTESVFITGMTFLVQCNPGFTTESPQGILLCDHHGNWVNKATCEGNILLTYFKGLNNCTKLNICYPAGIFGRIMVLVMDSQFYI